MALASGDCLRSWVCQHLPKRRLSGSAACSQTVEQAQKLFEAPHMLADRENHTLTCQNVAVVLPPQIFALAAWMTYRIVNMPYDEAPLRWESEDWNGYLKEYALVPDVVADTLSGMHRRFKTIDVSADEHESRKYFFQECLSRLRSALREELGPLAPQYTPETIGPRGNSSTRFPLRSDAIRFV